MGNPPTPLNHSNWKDSAESGRGTPPPLLPVQHHLYHDCLHNQLTLAMRHNFSTFEEYQPTQSELCLPSTTHSTLTMNTCLFLWKSTTPVSWMGLLTAPAFNFQVVKSAHNSSRSLEWMWNFQKQLKPLVTLYRCCKVPEYETVDYDVWLFQWLLS